MELKKRYKKLFDKFETPVVPDKKEALRRWQDSPYVAALSDALKTYPEMGIELVMKEGYPTLHCEPGIGKDEPERWEFLEYVTDLALKSRDDLHYLLDHGLLQLREANGSF